MTDKSKKTLTALEAHAELRDGLKLLVDAYSSPAGQELLKYEPKPKDQKAEMFTSEEQRKIDAQKKGITPDDKKPIKIKGATEQNLQEVVKDPNPLTSHMAKAQTNVIGGKRGNYSSGGLVSKLRSLSQKATPGSMGKAGGAGMPQMPKAPTMPQMPKTPTAPQAPKPMASPKAPTMGGGMQKSERLQKALDYVLQKMLPVRDAHERANMLADFRPQPNKVDMSRGVGMPHAPDRMGITGNSSIPKASPVKSNLRPNSSAGKADMSLPAAGGDMEIQRHPMEGKFGKDDSNMGMDGGGDMEMSEPMEKGGKSNLGDMRPDRRGAIKSKMDAKEMTGAKGPVVKPDPRLESLDKADNMKTSNDAEAQKAPDMSRLKMAHLNSSMKAAPLPPQRTPQISPPQRSLVPVKPRKVTPVPLNTIKYPMGTPSVNSPDATPPKPFNINPLGKAFNEAVGLHKLSKSESEALQKGILDSLKSMWGKGKEAVQSRYGGADHWQRQADATGSGKPQAQHATSDDVLQQGMNQNKPQPKPQGRNFSGSNSALLGQHAQDQDAQNYQKLQGSRQMTGDQHTVDAKQAEAQYAQQQSGAQQGAAMDAQVQGDAQIADMRNNVKGHHLRMGKEAFDQALNHESNGNMDMADRFHQLAQLHEQRATKHGASPEEISSSRQSMHQADAGSANPDAIFTKAPQEGALAHAELGGVPQSPKSSPMPAPAGPARMMSAIKPQSVGTQAQSNMSQGAMGRAGRSQPSMMRSEDGADAPEPKESKPKEAPKKESSPKSDKEDKPAPKEVSSGGVALGGIDKSKVLPMVAEIQACNNYFKKKGM